MNKIEEKAQKYIDKLPRPKYFPLLDEIAIESYKIGAKEMQEEIIKALEKYDTSDLPDNQQRGVNDGIYQAILVIEKL